MTTAALILAGGQGSRLGYVDKAFLCLNGQPLIALLLARLAPQVQHIAISANGDPSRFAALPLPVLADAPEHAGKGPLAGVAAGLAWAGQKLGAATLLTVPVDTPFAPMDLLARLSPAPAVACYGGRQHHLVAHWPVALLPTPANLPWHPRRLPRPRRAGAVRRPSGELHGPDRPVPQHQHPGRSGRCRKGRLLFVNKRSKKTFLMLGRGRCQRQSP